MVEVMVAVTIVTVGVLALQAFYTGILRSEQLSQDRIIAVHMAEQIIEEWQQSNILPKVNCTTNPKTPLTLATATLCTPSNSTGTVFSITPTSVTAQAPFAKAAGQVVWGNMVAMAGITPKIRTVTVSWDYKGQPKSIMLTHLTPAP